MKRVVVTGLGCVTPLGLDVNTTWAGMIAGENAIGPITRFDTTDHKAKLAAEIKNWAAENYFSKMEARKLDLFSQFGIVASKEAIEDSGIADNVDKDRFGVYLGSGVGGLNTMVDACMTIGETGGARVSAATIPMLIGNILSAHVAIRYGARGPTLPIVTACATGAHAIGEAYLAIQAGRADAIIAGGSEACINQMAMGGFANMMALSTETDPNAASLPFDKRRKGFVMGEGAGAVVLEEYEHAKKRGAKIYCEVIGYGNTCDAYHITAPEPNADGLIRALRLAVGEIKDTDKIYFNAHGTGTELNDKAETHAIKQVFAKPYDIAISSTKSMTGHMLGAAGVVESIAAIKALQTGTIPPTINLNEPDPELDLDYTPNKARRLDVNVAINTNLGFGGHNVALVFKKINGG